MATYFSIQDAWKSAGAPLDGSPYYSIAEARRAAVAATHWSQVSAANAKFLTAPDGSWGTEGTFIGVINPTAIGPSWGGVLYMKGPSGYTIWLALGPGSPDYLRGNIAHASVTSSVEVDAPGGNAALYDGSPKVVWLHWVASSTQRVGWGKPSAGNHDSTTCRPVAAYSGASVSVGNLIGINGSLGGEYEVAAFDRVLSDAEIDSIVDAGTIAHVTSGRYLYPVPAVGVIGTPPTVLTDPSTQVQDDSAHTWSLSTVDGTSDIEAIR